MIDRNSLLDLLGCIDGRAPSEHLGRAHHRHLLGVERAAVIADDKPSGAPRDRGGSRIPGGRSNVRSESLRLSTRSVRSRTGPRSTRSSKR
jgi:hypothetical protein